MRNRTLWFIVGLQMICASGLGHASSYVGKIKVHCNTDIGHCNVNVLGTPTDIPACAAYPSWYVFKMNSPLWKEQLAIALAAQVAGRNVSIFGAGTCTLRPGAHEDISSITLED